jgi:drug/metabolite transporter (DMT)-like permease
VRWNVSVAALSASWGFISIIVAGVGLSAGALGFYRLVLAALVVLAGVVLLRRVDLLRVPVLRLRLVLLGAVLGIHWFLFFATVKLSTVAVAILLIYTAPIFLALLAPLVLPEERSLVALSALVPAAVGLALIALAGEEGASVDPVAVATGLAAAITYAAAVIVAKQVVARLSVPAVQFWTYAVAGVVLLPALGFGGRILPSGSAEAVYVLVLGIVFTALSGFLYVWLLRKVTAQAIGILAYLEPVSAALLAWVILDQPLGWAVVAGGALVVAAGVLVVVYEPAEAAPVEAAPLPARASGE